MKNLRFPCRRFLCGLALGGLLVSPMVAASTPPKLTLLARHFQGTGGAEIASYAAADQVLLLTFSRKARRQHHVEVLSLQDPAAPQSIRRIDLAAVFTRAEGGVESVSSVAADPAGRGWGAVTVVPTRNHRHRGRVVLFDYRDGATLATVDVGYHPDGVAFSPDGRYVLTADEGEYRPGSAQVPGSLSVIDLAGLTRDDRSAWSALGSRTYDFTPANLASGLSVTHLRRHHSPTPGTVHLDLEPEYISVHGHEAFVSLQENNAIAVFDLNERRWVRVLDLGVISQTVDASDRDSPFGAAAPRLNDTLVGMPMPDTIKAFSHAGRVYVATANEGDARAHDAGDVMRLKHAGRAGPSLDPQARAELRRHYGSDP